MRQIIASSLLVIGMISAKLFAQDSAMIPPESPEQFGLRHLMEYMGLRPNDISFRSDYTDPDTFRLKVIADLMQTPLEMMVYTASIKNSFVASQPEILAAVLFQDLKREHQFRRTGAYEPQTAELTRTYNLYYADMAFNQLLTNMSRYLDVIIPKSTEKALARLSPEQRRFLYQQFKELIVMRVEEESFSVQQHDSLEQLEERYSEEFAAFGTLIDKDPLVAAGIDCLRRLVPDVESLRKRLQSGEVSAQKIIAGSGYLPDDDVRESYLGMQKGWVIGGTGNDYYHREYQFILDFGGDDVYELTYDSQRPHGTIIVDLAGDDHYRGRTDFAVGSGCFSTGLLLDLAGNDRYDAKSFALGSGYFGFGLLYDAGGDDRYDGDTHVQGAGTFGTGLLIDLAGRDIYNAAVYSQGFGFVEGAGLIVESDGSDTYYAGGKYKDILRYEDRYLSMSQGFGYGVRPWMSGGIGGIVDLKGNDSYYAEIFGQGASYWWSLGFLSDSSGNDSYQAFQYAQGAATHMTLGILTDDFGSDVYFGKGLMHGCGHDYACGLLLDRGGDDTYTAYDLSQGAGSANGAGVLIDNLGNDRYFIKNPENSQGYGNPRREYGSVGLFIDLGGADQYVGNGRDNFYWKTDSKWGAGMDIELTLPDTTKGVR